MYAAMEENIYLTVGRIIFAYARASMQLSLVFFQFQVVIEDVVSMDSCICRTEEGRVLEGMNLINSQFSFQAYQ